MQFKLHTPPKVVVQCEQPLHQGEEVLESPSPTHRRTCNGSALGTWMGLNNLILTSNTYFLRKLWRAGVGSSVLGTFYHCAVENVLCSSITMWHVSCSVVGRSLSSTLDVHLMMQEKGTFCIIKHSTQQRVSASSLWHTGRVRSIKRFLFIIYF